MGRKPKAPLTVVSVAGKDPAKDRPKYLYREKDDDLEPSYAYIVERSPSSTAMCHKCSTKIAKGLLRVGAPKKYKGGPDHFGYISMWQHVSCSRLAHYHGEAQALSDEQLESFDTDRDCYGAADLTVDERALVAAELTSSEVGPFASPSPSPSLARARAASLPLRAHRRHTSGDEDRARRGGSHRSERRYR